MKPAPLFALLLSIPALAQELAPSAEVLETRGDARSASDGYLTLPEGIGTVTPQLRFATADDGLGTGEIEFTDVVLLDLGARHSVGERAELFAHVTLLPKQPTQTRESVFQGGLVGTRFSLARGFAASLAGQAGPMLNGAGTWTTFDATLEARYAIDRYIYFQTGVGGEMTALFFRDPSSSPMLGDVFADAQLVFAQQRAFALWLGAQFRFPVTPAPREDLIPSTRVNARLGGAITYVRDWDLFAEFQIIDRGDTRAPGTTLPILDGGFDERVLVFGVTRRFGEEKRRDRYGEYDRYE